MSEYNKNESLLEMYLFESHQQIEDMERILLEIEKSGSFGKSEVNEIFRTMHTIKGSSAMMMYENIAKLAHSLENLFSFFRESNQEKITNTMTIDLTLESVDFIKEELAKIGSQSPLNGDSSQIIKRIESLLDQCKNGVEPIEVTVTMEKSRKYQASVSFESDCEMKSIRAFGIVHKLKDVATEIHHIPKDLTGDDEAENIIKNEGFKLTFETTVPYVQIDSIFEHTVFLKGYQINEVKDEVKKDELVSSKMTELTTKSASTHMGMISVNVQKLDALLDLVGELVISGMMVTQTNQMKGPQFATFRKAAVLHGKIINEIQDMSMSLRMVTVSSIFNKMSRIIRDVGKKLNKDIELELIGEETEIDKNIIESISDPLMHLVRNAADHGLESNEERRIANKNGNGKIILEAKNVGSEVWIFVRDNGKGLDKDKIYQKAYEKGLLTKPISEMSEEEIYMLIFQPGFSTKEVVTEFSGRGVGLDVVMKNIKNIGGNVSVNSRIGIGTDFIIKIPLTLAIIGGMTVKVGLSRYTIPTTGIRKCFRPHQKEIIRDTNGAEMILIREKCYPIIRLAQSFNEIGMKDNIDEGILILVENEKRKYCLFADELIGEQSVVVKALPEYIDKRINGISGCTLLGDGSISLIIDLESMI